MGVEGGCWSLTLSQSLHLHTAHCQTSPPIKHFHQAPPSCTNQPSSLSGWDQPWESWQQAQEYPSCLFCQWAALQTALTQGPRSLGNFWGPKPWGRKRQTTFGQWWALAWSRCKHWLRPYVPWPKKKKKSLGVETLSFIQQRFTELLLYAGTVIKSGDPRINKAWSLSLKNLQSGLPWWRSG